jgi:hypothetical protein
MCRQASVGPFIAFVRFEVKYILWSTPPAVFASSNRVERGFCAGCRTPIKYREIGGQYISFFLNGLDDPDAVAPEIAF